MPTCTCLSPFTPTCTRLHLPHSFTILHFNAFKTRAFVFVHTCLSSWYVLVFIRSRRYSFVFTHRYLFSSARARCTLVLACTHSLLLVRFLLDGTHSSSLIHTHSSLCTLILACAHSFLHARTHSCMRALILTCAHSFLHARTRSHPRTCSCLYAFVFTGVCFH